MVMIFQNITLYLRSNWSQVSMVLYIPRGQQYYFAMKVRIFH